jgi:PAS domain-containing protein
VGPADSISDLRGEVMRLRQRVFALEEELRKAREDVKAREAQHRRQVIQLLRQKDDKLGEYAEELERKNQELQRLVAQLEEKNEELQIWIHSLRLYQDIFEHESSLMIGVNAEGKIVLFNKAVTDRLGETFPQYLFRDIEEVDFGAFGGGVGPLVREALEHRERRISEREAATVAVFPIVGADHLRGALVKISPKI